MPIADMLVDAAAGHKVISFMDDNAGYNQIFMAEEDIAKIAFRYPGTIGLFEWVVMTFGLKNASATKIELQSLLGKINFIRRFISNMSERIMSLSPLLKLKNDQKFKWG